MEFNYSLTFIIGIILLIIFCKIFSLPLNKIFKLILNSILGGLLIWVINFIGANFNFHLGLNWFTSIFVGILGVPGTVLLIILKLLI